MRKKLPSQEINLRRVIKSNIDYKILNFFHNSPSSIDTARGISTWINEKREDTRKSLDKLAKFKILLSLKNRFVVGYSYTQDVNIVKKINRFLGNNKSNFNKLKE